MSSYLPRYMLDFQILGFIFDDNVRLDIFKWIPRKITVPQTHLYICVCVIYIHVYNIIHMWGIRVRGTSFAVSSQATQELILATEHCYKMSQPVLIWCMRSGEKNKREKDNNCRETNLYAGKKKRRETVDNSLLVVLLMWAWNSESCRVLDWGASMCVPYGGCMKVSPSLIFPCGAAQVMGEPERSVRNYTGSFVKRVAT